MSDLHVRAAARNDDPALLALIADHQDYHRSLEPHWPAGQDIAADYLRYLEDECAAHDGAIFVAVDGASLAGFVCVVSDKRGAPDNPRRHAFVYDLFVAPNHRRRGIARMLMDSAASFAGSRGVRELRLAVLEHNAGARAFYASLGFRDYARTLTKPIPVVEPAER